jgi:alpha-ketoglutarate-dependent taurine dioxygenase
MTDPVTALTTSVIASVDFQETDPQTILFLAANKRTDPLRFDRELRDIAEGLRRAQKRDRFNLEQRSALHPRDIQRAMLELSPQIIHFSGHEEGETGLVFEDENGNTRLVDSNALANLFKLFADQLHSVLLIGCYSEVQAKAISQHIPYVIGMNQEIWHKAAISFAVGFYDALGAGRDVEFAFELGCSAIRMEGTEEGITPVLIKKSVVAREQDLVNPTSQSLASISKTQLMAPNSKDLKDFEIYRIREYKFTINSLVIKATNSFDMILRSGKILDECSENLKEALKRGCDIRVILLDRRNISLIRSMSYESNNSLEMIKLNFSYGEIAINKLKDFSEESKGKFEIAMCNHYLPSELVFISTFDDSKGLVYSTPLKFRQSPRSSPSILSSVENKPEIFKSYQDEFNSLWKYLNSDKDFDSNFEISRALLEIQTVGKISKNEIDNMYKIFQRWGFVVIRPNETGEDMGYFEDELLELKKYFGNDFEHERSRENGITTIKLELGFPNYFGTNNARTGLHTDGSYDKNPPKIVIHQCIVPSENGGETLLVSFKNVYRQIANDESIITLLSCPTNTFTISRDGRVFTRSVFCDCEEDGRIRASFRSCRHQKTATVFATSPDGYIERAFDKLDEIIHRPESILTFKLNKFDILVLDNTSVLHGRKEFEDNSDRTLHRLMLDGQIDCHREKLCFGFEP